MRESKVEILRLIDFYVIRRTLTSDEATLSINNTVLSLVGKFLNAKFEFLQESGSPGFGHVFDGSIFCRVPSDDKRRQVGGNRHCTRQLRSPAQVTTR